MKSTEFEHLLKAHLNSDEDPAPAPDLLLVFEARQAVMARRKSQRRLAARARDLLSSLTPLFSVQHVGFAALLIGGCMLYFSEVAGSRHHDRTFSDAGGSSTISSTTISVISSTMLTSIPTLRN